MPRLQSTPTVKSIPTSSSIDNNSSLSDTDKSGNVPILVRKVSNKKSDHSQFVDVQAIKKGITCENGEYSHGSDNMTVTVVNRDRKVVKGISRFENDVLSISSSMDGVKTDTNLERDILKSKIFEAISSFELIKNRGNIYETYDYLCNKLDEVFTRAENYKGNISGKSASSFLLDMIRPMNTDSDQVGRYLGQTKLDDKALVEWIREQIKTPSKTHYELLTKIRILGAFGIKIRSLMLDGDLSNIEALGKVIKDDIKDRFSEYNMKTRSAATFDDPIRLARIEKEVLNGDNSEIKGQVYRQREGNIEIKGCNDPNEERKLRIAVGENSENINGAKRKEQGISNPNRPFSFSDVEMKKIPDELKKLIKDNPVKHGSAANRWKPYGMFALDSMQRGFPSLCGHSGSFANTMLMVHILSDESMYKKESRNTVISAILGCAAYMNFSSYHTFIETLPIGQKILDDKIFNPNLDKKIMSPQHFYNNFLNLAREVGYDLEHLRSFLSETSMSQINPTDIEWHIR
ncbi:hypothetical protein O1C43_003584 [Vibrio cholerae]|uniref:hypothetical protein n=1 Tax=Vibrio cholerae TaxID=666 RepID=UPI001DCAA6C3|nr:hypothetical protein [Vibrio cholerae]EGQ9189789.1 hypothetical protein [Vibrio cholerae]EJL6268062.1 hypothetical protein [Vibrio cholerae]EJX9126117.1 hypothetical protein [Vibrio cholerae]EJY0789434.1 hypothetical protein [Vibrio cholerae]EKF9603737.1 hypothetical protein [Vibrio cholerae]